MKLRWIPVLTAAMIALSFVPAWAQVVAPVPPPTPDMLQAARPTVVPEAPQAPKVVKAPAVPEAPQAPKVTKVPEAPVAPLPPPRRQGQLVNVKVELTITDQIGSAVPEKKNIMMLVADGERGQIRSNAQVQRRVEQVVGEKTIASSQWDAVPLAVDAWPEVEGGKIRLRLSLEYDLIGEKATGGGKTSIRESLSVILTDGVPLTAALSADPMTDRKVTLEVKAAVVK